MKEYYISIKKLWLNKEIYYEKLGEPRNLGCQLNDKVAIGNDS